MSEATSAPSAQNQELTGFRALGDVPRTGLPYIGRIPATDLEPVLDHGRLPAKAVVGEAIPIRATVFREGFQSYGATVVLIDPSGVEYSRTRMESIYDIIVELEPAKKDYRFEAWVVPNAPGVWTFLVEGWHDPYDTWRQAALLKVPAGVDVELMFIEGASLLESALTRLNLSNEDEQTVRNAIAGMQDTSLDAAKRLDAGTNEEIADVFYRTPLRDMVSPTEEYPVLVDRERALYGSWYEFFVRSEGAWFDEKQNTWHSGTLQTASRRLDDIADMGFDFAYITPIHPIGMTNRKGRNDTLTAEPGDPGSPYAIGSADGGHDAIDPVLGTFDDFDDFVAHAHELGLEVAMDLALQCSPDHPWLKEHPEWFNIQADGTIAYAENPPKKYQDIYPLNYDRDAEGLYQEVKRVLEVWISHGVTAFRVDNPHTKPFPFWQRLLAEIAVDHPDVIFLAEAFTNPVILRALSMIGYHQSYTHFTWKVKKKDLETYLMRVSHVIDSMVRPAFWVNTHDILIEYLQEGGAPAFFVRAIIATMGSPTWGVYAGYELAEHIPRPGAEEQIDNEKYEYKPRDWKAAEPIGLIALMRDLNQMRRDHPALQRLRNISIHLTGDDQVLCFAKHLPAHLSPTGKSDTVIVVVNLDWSAPHTIDLDLDLEVLGIDAASVPVTDLLNGGDETLKARSRVELGVGRQCAKIFWVRQP